MYNTSQGAQGIPKKSKYKQKYENFRFSSPKTAIDPGVSSSEPHELDLFDETSKAGSGVFSKMTRYNPPLDRIIRLNARTPESGSWRRALVQTNSPPTLASPVTREQTGLPVTALKQDQTDKTS